MSRARWAGQQVDERKAAAEQPMKLQKGKCLLVSHGHALPQSLMPPPHFPGSGDDPETEKSPGGFEGGPEVRAPP